MRYDVCSGKADPVSPAIAGLANPAAFAESRLRLVKFGGPIAPAQRRAVENLGAEILAYAPYYAYVVRMDRSRDAQARAIPGVVWVGPFLPAFKLDPNLARDLAGARIAERGNVDRLEIGLQPGSSEAAVRSAIFSLPGIVQQFSEDGGDHRRLVVRFDRALLAGEPAAARRERRGGLRRLSLAPRNSSTPRPDGSTRGARPRRAPPGRSSRAASSAAGRPWPPSTPASPSPTAASATAPPPPVSVCNTGASCPAGTPNPALRKVVMYYEWSGGAGPDDGHGHGTHVMGSLAGNNAGTGGRGLHGLHHAGRQHGSRWHRPGREADRAGGGHFPRVPQQPRRHPLSRRRHRLAERRADPQQLLGLELPQPLRLHLGLHGGLPGDQPGWGPGGLGPTRSRRLRRRRQQRRRARRSRLRARVPTSARPATPRTSSRSAATSAAPPATTCPASPRAVRPRTGAPSRT
ncbi:MAG: hypothetical protein RML12_06005 [Xanthomonadales bacterium]|nr:hypothetical protein [Xanthomonadales bacterium]